MLFFSRLQRQPVYASQVSCPQTSNPQFMVFRYVTLITLWSVLVSTPSKLADVAEGDAGEVLVLPLSSANWKLTPMWLVISDIWTGKTFRPTPWSSSQDPHFMYPFKCQPPPISKVFSNSFLYVSLSASYCWPIYCLCLWLLLQSKFL